MRNAEDITASSRACTASSLLTTIFEQTTRGVQYHLYPLECSCGFLPITKIHKVLLDRHVISLLHHVNVIQTLNKVMQIHNSAANYLCNLLADQLI